MTWVLMLVPVEEDEEMRSMMPILGRLPSPPFSRMVEPFSRRLNVKLDCPVGSSVSTSSNSMYCGGEGREEGGGGGGGGR
jgi:uncharacterized membrane protein